MSTEARATFDENNHCATEGWATYMHPRNLRERLCRHRIDTPVPKNDYCPQAYTRCVRCLRPFRWFNVGTHRLGSYAKPVFDAYRKQGVRL